MLVIIARYWAIFKHEKQFYNYFMEEINMITFDPLFKTLKKKDITQYQLIKLGLSTGQLDRIRKNQSVTLNTIDHLCMLLDCDISDIIELHK